MDNNYRNFITVGDFVDYLSGFDDNVKIFFLEETPDGSFTNSNGVTLNEFENFTYATYDEEGNAKESHEDKALLLIHYQTPARESTENE